MNSLSWGLSLPYQRVARWRRRGQGGWPSAPRPTISVGNLAFGGRGKTPLVAAIAQEAISAGLRPAILTRGYGGRINQRSAPEVVVADGHGPSWLQAVSASRSRVGEEACWLAAVCPGAPVGVSPDRERSATKILSEGTVDLFILDDGFQTRIQRDVDLVLLDATLDPPFAVRQGPLREEAAALRRASALGILNRETHLPSKGHARTNQIPRFSLTRRFRSLRRLKDGSVLTHTDWPGEVLVAAAVGQPDSVGGVLTTVGIRAVQSIGLRDHARPSSRQLRRLRNSPIPIVVTEKDAISWASKDLPEALVLKVELEGADALARWAIERLEL